MNTRNMNCGTRPLTERGYALLVTMGFLGIMLIALASAISWTSNESNLTSRNNLYNSTVAAAEGATEMVIAQLDRDFVYQSVNTDLNQYRILTPTALQSDWPVRFEFSDGSGTVGQTGVIGFGETTSTNINSQFAGLYGDVLPFRVTSQARTLNQLYNVSAAVSQDIQLASIPVFQFAIFYTLNLEINPGPLMTINGKVHSNGNLYAAPVTGLNFQDYVTYTGTYFNDRDPNDPQYGSYKVAPVYGVGSNAVQSSALTLPVGVDNSPASIQDIIKPPPFGEDPNSEISQQRYYNKSDLIVTTTTNGTVQVTTGRWDNFAPIPPDVTNAAGPSYSFLTTSKSFTDFRENKPTITTEVDVGALATWMQKTNGGASANARAGSIMGHQLDSVYVDDQRSSSGKLTAVRLVNGATMPTTNGLTVATQLPLYVQGNYNLNNGDTTVGQTDTALTRPASLVGDAVTILSPKWNDTYGAGTTAGDRQAGNTTVNAAIIAGIVSTTKVGNNKYYSGGVENFPRFLEDWGSNGKSLTYNGSMVVMFNSRFSTNFWKGPSTTAYYVAPTRRWAFDVNFLDHAKLPPSTPQLRVLVRGQWTVVSR